MNTANHTTVSWGTDRSRPSQASAGVQPSRMVLVIARGAEARIVPLSLGRAVVVGRGEGAEVQVPDPSLSRTHARFRWHGATVTVTDLGSRNGTLHRNQTVSEAELQAGEVVILGCVTVAVQALGSRLTTRDGESRSTAPRKTLSSPSPTHTAVRSNPAMLEVERLVARAARHEVAVLVLGETGTGKELIAREVHDRSPRAKGPFVVINCAAIPATLLESVLFGHKKGTFTGADCDRPGVFEQARGGTLFMDEIGELSPAAQAALLRVLEQKRFSPIGGTRELEADVRVVAATHRDLSAMAAQERFRLDLYHRLNTFTVELPPLRERRDEIPLLAHRFLAEFASKSGGGPTRIEPRAMTALVDYAWPGNVRELKNVIERAVVVAERDHIELCDLPRQLSVRAAGAPPALRPIPAQPLVPRTSLHEQIRQQEARLIRDTLALTRGNRREAAELLRVPLRTLQRRIARFGIPGPRRGGEDA